MENLEEVCMHSEANGIVAEWTWIGEREEQLLVSCSYKEGIAIYQGGGDYKKSIFGGERSRIRCFKHVEFGMAIRSKKSYLPCGY